MDFKVRLGYQNMTQMRGPKKLLTSRDIQTAFKTYSEATSDVGLMQGIADAYGVSVTTLWRAFKKAGYVLKDQREVFKTLCTDKELAEIFTEFDKLSKEYTNKRGVEMLLANKFTIPEEIIHKIVSSKKCRTRSKKHLLGLKTPNTDMNTK